VGEKRKLKRDNIIAGLALIGAGLGWLVGAFFPGLLIGVGVGLIFCSIYSQKTIKNLNDLKPSAETFQSKESAAYSGNKSTPRPANPEYTEERNIDIIWDRIVANQGQVFYLAKGQPFTYEVAGKALIPNTTNVKIHKSQFAKALEKLPFEKVSDVPANVFGPSYVYAILMDPRIRKGEW